MHQVDVSEMEETEEDEEVYAKRLRLTFSGADESEVCKARDETKTVCNCVLIFINLFSGLF